MVNFLFEGGFCLRVCVPKFVCFWMLVCLCTCYCSCIHIYICIFVNTAAWNFTYKHIFLLFVVGWYIYIYISFWCLEYQLLKILLLVQMLKKKKEYKVTLTWLQVRSFGAGGRFGGLNFSGLSVTGRQRLSSSLSLLSLEVKFRNFSIRPEA